NKVKDAGFERSLVKKSDKHCGFIALVGRPNVGKSTLLNRLVKQKISITSRKPQTTRHRIAGIYEEGHYQFVFLDTPGLHRKKFSEMNRIMNKTAIRVLCESDVIVFMIEGEQWTKEDEWIKEKWIETAKTPIILVINKADKIKEKEKLLPIIEKLSKSACFKAIVPLSAKTGDNLEGLLNEIKRFLPKNSFFYSEGQITDRSERFLCAELIREKAMRLTGKEVPYAMTVEIESFKIKDKVTHIHAILWVEKENQKGIIIGESGERLKKVGMQARLEMEKMLGNKVFLKLWCKVKSSWSTDKRALQSLGYFD
ncbi:MAG: hypothetical protein ACD_44C00315G0001, partial [uncultured bacterium]